MTSSDTLNCAVSKGKNMEEKNLIELKEVSDLLDLAKKLDEYMHKTCEFFQPDRQPVTPEEFWEFYKENAWCNYSFRIIEQILSKKKIIEVKPNSSHD